MTELKQYYLDLPRKSRAEFRTKIMDMCGIPLRTFYRYLSVIPPKLIREKITTEVPINNHWNDTSHGKY